MTRIKQWIIGSIIAITTLLGTNREIAIFSVLGSFFFRNPYITQGEINTQQNADLSDPYEIILPDDLQQVIFCESGFRHLDSEGNVLRGKANPLDIGIAQINLKYHGEEAERMGLDLFDEMDNLRYALYLYEKNGLSDWRNSRNCWQERV